MVYVHGTVTITKGFDTWRTMVEGSKAEMDSLGMKVLFAATEADDDTKLHVIIQFPNMDAAKMFSTNEEVTEKRRKAGVLIETTVMTPLAEPMINIPQPKRRGVFVEVIDDASWFKPQAYVYTSRKLPHTPVDSKIEAFDKNAATMKMELGELGYRWNLLKEMLVAPTAATNLSR